AAAPNGVAIWARSSERGIVCAHSTSGGDIGEAERAEQRWNFERSGSLFAATRHFGDPVEALKAGGQGIRSGGFKGGDFGCKIGQRQPVSARQRVPEFNHIIVRRLGAKSQTELAIGHLEPVNPR